MKNRQPLRPLGIALAEKDLDEYLTDDATVTVDADPLVTLDEEADLEEIQEELERARMYLADVERTLNLLVEHGARLEVVDEESVEASFKSDEAARKALAAVRDTDLLYILLSTADEDDDSEDED